MRKCIAILILLFGLTELMAAGITLTEVPLRLYRTTSTIQVRWLEPITAKMKFGTSSGQYDKVTTASGTGVLTFVPQDEGMPPGVYYCIISSGSLSSAEFKVMIESTVAPTMIAPANNASINTASPTFRWDPVPGVPFYHLILSDQEVTLIRDDNDELQLEGGNIIYQIITPNTSVVYGEPDPSGFFTLFNGTPPPLMENFEYNWIVLNNYANHPGYSSLVQSGVSSFRVNIDQALAAPVLLSPPDKAVLAQPAIDFTWSAVSNAASYQVLLSETRDQDGSESSYIIWRPITTETSIELPARRMLRGNKYFWRVVALDEAGRGIASERRDFFYNVPFGTLRIRTRKTDRSILPRVEIIIVPQDGSSENTKLITTDSGVLDNPVQPGTYTVSAFKEGYADTSVTARVNAGDTVDVNLTLRSLQQAISGRVVDHAGRAVAGASVYFREYSSAIQKTALSDGEGRFSLSLIPGTWYIYAASSGYTNSDTVAVNLNYGQNVKLSSVLKLVENAAHLLGKVTTSGGIPIVSAVVTADNGAERISTHTNYNGLFDLELVAGEWQVFAEKDGFIRSATRTITLSRGASMTLTPDLTLSTNAAIVAGFIRSAATALQGAQVLAVPDAGQVLTSVSDPQGSFLLSLLPGNYLIKVALKGYVSESEIFLQLAEKQTISGLEFRLVPATSYIKGYIRRGSAPVAGAIVVCDVASDTSGADGSYQLGVTPGDYTVNAFYKGLLSSGAKRVTVGKGEIKENINLSMTSDAGIVAGLVTYNGLAVPFATITAQAGTEQHTTFTGMDGTYWLSLPAGIWDVSAAKVGFEKKIFNGVALNQGQSVSGVDFSLIATGSVLRGTVKDSRGRNIRNAQILISDNEIIAGSDRFGNYALALNPGSYHVVAQKPGFVRQEQSLTIAPNQTKTMNFSLPIMGVVTGTITDPDGDRLNKIELMALGQDTVRAETDYTGEYVLFLHSGNYRLVADKLGYHAGSANFSIQLGDTLVRNFTLAENPGEIARITGRLLDSKGQPMAGVGIKILGPETVTIYSDFNGGYATDILEVGKVYTLKPQAKKRFFVPSERRFNPLKADKNNQNFVSGYFGDVSGNELVSSFDGSLVLRLRAEQDVSPFYRTLPRDSIAADVSGNAEVSAFDASLIFRYSAGLIEKFPADRTTLLKPIQSDSVQRTIALVAAEISGSEWQIDLSIDNSRNVLSGEFQIKYDPVHLEFLRAEKSGMSRNVHLVYGNKVGGLKVAFASEEPLSGQGALLHLYFKPISTTGNATPSVRLVNARLNENRIPVKIVQQADGGDYSFRLFGNYPNPFNSSTLIRYSLPTPGNGTLPVRVSIYNVLGQKVKTLVDARQAGGLYTVHWNGTDETGHPVPSGVYFYRIEAGRFSNSQKLLLMR